MEKSSRAGQATDDNIMRHKRVGWWIAKATDTYSEYEIFIVFHGNNGCTNASQCYVYTYIASLVMVVKSLCIVS